MRWFARRLVFYVFALWVALTINFLLPRLMPGSPIDGILQHLTPSQLAANPGIVQTYEALLGGGNNSIWQDYVTYLSRIVHLDFGISTSNYPTPVSEVVGQTLPYSIFLVGVAFFLSFVIGTGDRDGRRLAPRRRRRQRLRPDLHGARARSPPSSQRCSRSTSSASSCSWFPIQHAYDNGLTPGFNWDVPLERVPPRAAADPRHPRRVHGRVDAEHAHRDDQHDRRGLRDHGPRQGTARPARDDAGTQDGTRSSRRSTGSPRSSRAPSAGSSSSSSSSATPAPASRSSRRCSGTTTRSRRRCSSCSRSA